jgi:hypothetical protein
MCTPADQSREGLLPRLSQRVWRKPQWLNAAAVPLGPRCLGNQLGAGLRQFAVGLLRGWHRRPPGLHDEIRALVGRFLRGPNSAMAMKRAR